MKKNDNTFSFSFHRGFLYIGAPLVLASAVQANLITALSFDSLPSAQGWTLTKAGPHGNDSEASLFSVNNGSLFQTTVGTGQGSSSPGNATYRYDIPASFATADTVSLFFTTAVTDHEQTRQDFSYAAHRFTIVFGGQTAFVGIKPTELNAMRSYFAPVGFNGSVANSYQLTLDSTNNLYEFYLNGDLVRSGTSEATALYHQHLSDPQLLKGAVQLCL